MNDIPTKFCKLAGTTVSNFLPELFNLCIIESEYLYELKIAQIILVHKSESKECCFKLSTDIYITAS